MSWIEYNGIRSTDLGVIVERMPDAQRATLRFTEQDVPGRYGKSYTAEDDVYESIEIEVVLNCFGKTNPRAVFKWLKGAGYLITSDDPTKKRYVRFYDSITATRDRNGLIYDSITAKMVADPFCVNITESDINANASPTFTGNGDMLSEPLLTITGTGIDATVILNGTTMILSELSKTVYIDCESKMAYTHENGITEMYTDVTIINNDNFDRWAKLNPDTNLVTVTGCTCTITPRWRFF